MRIAEKYKSFDSVRRSFVEESKKNSFFNSLWHAFTLAKLQKELKCNKNEYFYYGLYNMNKSEREKYAMENGFERDYVLQWNSRECMAITANKPGFNKLFPEYIRRDWIYMPDASFEKFEEFALKHKVCIEKPDDGQSGRGVCKREFPAKEELPALYERLKDCGLLFEELLHQDKALALLNPDSVNTIRIITLRRDEKPEIIMAGLRIGRKGSCADNFGAGGICGKIDFKSGVVTSPAVGKMNKRYSHHPDTGVSIVGFKIPMWEDLKKTAIECASKMPNNLLGWDLSVNEKKQVVIIEANSAPDIMFMQLVEEHGFAETLTK